MQICIPVIACALVMTMAPVPQPAVDANPISQALKQAWDDAKGNMQASAEQMPEADYAFKPAEQVRTFGQILAHVAGANYVFCSAARGEKSPFTEDHFEKSATTKAAIVKALSDSIAYCDVAYAGLTDAKAGESVAMPFGMGRRAARIRADGEHGPPAGTLRQPGDLLPDQGHGAAVEPAVRCRDQVRKFEGSEVGFQPAAHGMRRRSAGTGARTDRDHGSRQIDSAGRAGRADDRHAEASPHR